MFKNVDNASLEYYKGLIRTTDAKLKSALARIAKLEKKLKEIKRVQPSAESNLGFFSDEETQRNTRLGTNYENTLTPPSLSASDVIAIINNAIENGQLRISIHDHTADDKGGDSYASKGASLI